MDRKGLQVLDGPFEGLRLPDGSTREHLSPYLLGTYESELHAWLEELRGEPIVQVVDIGAKFGYYAVGLARWWPEARSIAFDTDPWARRMLRETAALNGIRDLDVRGYLRPGELAQLVRAPGLIVSDCEGFEAELFAAADPAALVGCWLVIELHPEAVPGVEELLRERFRETHSIEVRGREEREPPAFLSEFLSEEEARLAVTEFRGDQRWMFCRPLERPTSVESTG